MPQSSARSSGQQSPSGKGCGLDAVDVVPASWRAALTMSGRSASASVPVKSHAVRSEVRPFIGVMPLVCDPYSKCKSFEKL